MSLYASTDFVDGTGLVGTVNLNDVGPWVLDPAGHTYLRAAPNAIAVGLQKAGADINLFVSSAQLTSGSTYFKAGPNFVGPYWDRQNSTAITDFFSLLTALLVVSFGIHVARRRVVTDGRRTVAIANMDAKPKDPRTTQERVSDLLWGASEPSAPLRKRLEAVRASVSTQAGAAESMYLHELDKVRAGHGVIARPPRAERQKIGHAIGEYWRAHSGEWDWFEGLGRGEQARLWDMGWFAKPGEGESPDEIAERVPIREWLQLTRNVDMTGAMATGRYTNPKRYGGQDPRSLIVGEPYDFAELHHEDAGRAARHLRHVMEGGLLGVNGGSQCQFRTRPDGTVYPLAGTCSPRQPAVGYYLNAHGKRVAVQPRDYGADEVF